MSEIFGNLDNFLENYDEDDVASTSALNDSQDSIANDSLDSSRSDGARKTLAAKNKATGKRKSNAGGKRSQSSKSTSSTSADSIADVGHTLDTLASTPELLPPVVDLTPTVAGVGDEIRQLSRLFDSIFCSQNPIVKEFLKNRNATAAKRAYTTVCNSYHRKPPVTANDMKKIMGKIDASKRSLQQLEQEIQTLLSPVSTNPFPPPRSRRSRGPTAQGNRAPVLAVISLDCDDDPTPSQPIFQSQYRRVTRRSGANEAGTQSNTISLDSDDESGDGAVELEPSFSAANSSFETENYEMRIKIKWGRGIETFVHRRYQKFEDIFNQLAAKESADRACIFLNLDDRIVYASDTPDSIDYKPHQFIAGRILKTKAPILPTAHGSSTGHNSNMITLKVQMEKRKQPLRLQIDKNQTMSVLVIKCAEELKCEPKDIRLYFDGELVGNNDKPEDLDLEGDEILDIRFVK